MSFYQSEVRQTIQEIIYQKPTFTITLFGKEYFGTIKTRKIGFITTKRYQILGITLPEDPILIKQEIEKIKQQFGNKKNNIFFQRGITNEIVSFDIKNMIGYEFAEELREGRIFLRKYIQEQYGLPHAFRENMPESNITQDLSRSEEEMLLDMNESAQDRAKKALKKNIEFTTATEQEYEEFFRKRQETAGQKGFNTVTKEQYLKLIKYLIKTGKGQLFVTKKNQEIVAGTLAVYHNKTIVCLYGFVDRNHTHSGGQQYLKRKLFNRGKENGYVVCDMFGGAPTGFPTHELASVSAFKESTGGKKTEYYGNYDIPLNKTIYKFFKRYYCLKK